MPNVSVTDNTLVEALLQSESKLEYLYRTVKNNPLYEEAIQKIRGLKKIEGKSDSEIEKRPDSIGNRLMASSLLATGYGGIGGLQ